MALGTFVAGRFSAALNSLPLGICQQGVQIEFQFREEAIDETDLYGSTIIDLILRGCNTFVSARLIEWLAAGKAALWPLGGSVMGKIFTPSVPAGVLASGLATPLVLTAQANTPAANSPASLTASKAFPAPGFNPQWSMDSRLRVLPVRFICLPYQSADDVVAFSTS